ncbi:hypothetical protein K26PH128C1_LOCUS5 [Klebsiella phage vB_Ko_K26PH128C1]|uniref:Uncharacterized protein n=1 Tax=Klebsiella phage vB_Ko_K26PH128C1 TaxID=3071634 RepID=A0AAV1MDV4_9CAUD|nr:hypothetical protein K26PH128C1_LOCUS5 [Klebsiella phage vB_Ko_K26PH128C1]
MGKPWVILYVVVSGTLGYYMLMSLCPYLLVLIKSYLEYHLRSQPEVIPETIYLRLTNGTLG